MSVCVILLMLENKSVSYTDLNCKIDSCAIDIELDLLIFRYESKETASRKNDIF